MIKSNGIYDNVPHANKKYTYYSAYLSKPNTLTMERFDRVLKLDNYEEGSQNRSTAALFDVDGDGRLELFGINIRTLNYYIESFDERFPQIFVPKGNNFKAIGLGSYSLNPTDYDGDGKTELILQFKNSNKSLKFYIDINNSKFIQQNAGEITDLLRGTNIFSGLRAGIDFNGDGMQDLLKRTNDVNNQPINKILTSRGYDKTNGFTESAYNERYARDIIPIKSDNVPYFYVDVNGDGKTDIVSISKSAKSIVVALSTGDLDNFVADIKLFLFPFNSVIDVTSVFNFGDFNGDGNLELLHKRHKDVNTCCADIITLSSLASPSPQNKLLVAVKDGLNNQIDFNYSTLSNQKNYSKEMVQAIH